MRSLTLTLLGLLAAVPASASAPFSIDMVTTEYPGSCALPTPQFEGDAFFHVNALPIPGYTSAVDSKHSPPEWAELVSAFDSTLLIPGSNAIDFNILTVNNSDWCTYSRHQVWMFDGVGKQHDLFDIVRKGNAYNGSTKINIDLQQIDPLLANDLINFKNELADNEAWLLKNAAASDALAKELDRLANLESEIDDLLKKGFDQITQADLDAILSQYADVGPEVQAALDQLLADLKKDIQQYRDEIAQLVQTFRNQADAVTDGILSGQARSSGFDPGSSSNYTPGADTTGIPDVPVPQLGTDPFDPTHDPYATYATSILAQLDATISNGKVQKRSEFMSTVAGWRTNQRVVQKALQLRSGISQAEWAAFLNAQNNVLSRVRTYMDDNDWFRDAPIPDELKGLVDLIMAAKFTNQAKGLKEGLNQWTGPQPTPQQQLIVDTLLALKSPIAEIEDEAIEEPAAPSTMSKILDGALVVVKEVGKLAIYVSPVGPFISVCEVVTGRELCNPWGNKLSTGERIFSGAGVFLGSVKLWKNLGKALFGVGTVAAAGGKEIAAVFNAVERGAGGFTKVGTNSYKSAAGIIYGADPVFGNRAVHVLTHGFENATKQTHSVFTGPLEDVLKLVDEAWLKPRVRVPGDSRAFLVDMGRVIGTNGQKVIRLVIEPGTSNLMSAYPF